MFAPDYIRAYPVIGKSDTMKFRVLEFKGAINNPNDVPAPCQYLMPTWAQMEELAFRLSHEVQKQKITVDAVIAAANGGLPYATLLRDRLDQGGKILTIGVTGYDDQNKALDGRHLVYSVPDDVSLKGKSILVVDDINDRGKTEVAIKASVVGRNPKLVKGVAFFQRPNTEHPSDLVGCSIEDDQSPWVVFPHDLYDSIKKIGGVWLGQGVSRDVIHRRFNLMFQVDKQAYLLPQIEDAMEKFFAKAT